VQAIEMQKQGCTETGLRQYGMEKMLLFSLPVAPVVFLCSPVRQYSLMNCRQSRGFQRGAPENFKTAD
jgi:hypothetical protein